jgi:PKD domain-containing protein
MAVTYQKVPVTLTPQSPIPDEALPSAGLDDEDAEIVAQASADYTADSAVGIEATVTGFDVDVLLSPATEFEEGYRVDWDFGDGRLETGADDLDQHYTYARPGVYTIQAVVSQPGEASFAVSTYAAVGEPDEPVG